MWSKLARCQKQHQGREISRWLKNSAFCTKFFANLHFFAIFPELVPELYKSQHFTICQYSAKQHSGIIYYISQQSHVTHQLVLWNLVELIHIIIIVTHETIDGQPRCQYILITFGLAYGSRQPFSLARKQPSHAAIMHDSAPPSCMSQSWAHSSASICPALAAQSTVISFKHSFKSEDACWYSLLYRLSSILHCPLYTASLISSISSTSFHQSIT